MMNDPMMSGGQGLSNGMLEQLMMNNQGSKLGDAMQMAKFRQSQGNSMMPAARQPVETASLAPPTGAKGIQGAPVDSTSSRPMSEIIDKAAGDDVSQRANQEQLSNVRPSRKPGQVASAPQSRGIAAAARPQTGMQDPLMAAIMRLVTMKQGQAKGTAR